MTIDNFDHMDEEEVRDLRHTLSALIQSEGWFFLERFLKERVEQRQRDLLTLLPSSIEEFVHFARVQGGIEEAKLIPDMIKAVLAETEQVLRQMDIDQGDQDYGTE